MKNKIKFKFLAIIFILIANIVLSQCPTNPVVIANQEGVNLFSSTYPNCHKVLNSLSLIDSESSPIIDLSSLKKIDTILGDFKIRLRGNPSLEVLKNLKLVQGTLEFYNTNLEFISGFDNLETVGSIEIGENYKLKEVAGFQNLKTISKTLIFSYLPVLEKVQGFDNLKNAGNLTISPYNKLKEIPNFNSIEVIKESITFGGTNLKEYTGFKDLKTVGKNMQFYFTEVTKLDIAPEITKVGDLKLSGMPLLTNLKGFDSLISANNIAISLPLLTEINSFNKVNTIANSLSITGEKLLMLNAFTKLKTLNTIYVFAPNTSFPRIGESLIKVNGNFTFYSSNAETCNDFSELTEVKGNLDLWLGKVPNLPDFKNLQLTGGLVIKSCRNIKKIKGFNKLHTINGSLNILYNNTLDSIDAFHYLKICKKSLELNSNDVLTYLSEFNNLDSLGGISFNQNRKLKKISGFNNLKYLYNTEGPISFYLEQGFDLQSISGFEKLEICGRLYMENTTAIKKFSGFNSLREFRGDVAITGRIPELPDFNALKIIKVSFKIENQTLKKFPEMENLETIETDLWISNCLLINSLPNWNKLREIKGFIRISGLLLIKDINGISKVNPMFVKDLSITYNKNLTICNNNFICGYLELSKPNLIKENAPGCNNKDEIVCDGGFVYGKVFYDRNSNKSLDPDEIGVPNQKILINDDIIAITNEIGQFGFYGETNLPYKVECLLSDNFKFSTDTIIYNIIFEEALKNTQQFNFGILNDKLIHNGSINLSSQVTRCNEFVWFKIHSTNNGSYDENGEIKFYYKDIAKVESFSTPPSNIDLLNGFCSWNFTNFIPPSSQTISFQIKMPTEDFTGDTLDFKANYSIKDLNNNYILIDSTSLESRLRCAYDPNDKAVSPLGKGEDHTINENSILTYTIRFQNVGNDIAKNIRIEDDLSDFFDLESFKFIYSSHRCNILRKNKGLFFYFNDINLIDSFTNPEKSQGYVTFSLKLKSDISDNSKVENLAKIYFDQNSPIITNTVFNTVGELVKTKEIFSWKDVKSILFDHPNPIYLTRQELV